MPQPKSQSKLLIAVDPGANGGIAYSVDTIYIHTMKIVEDRATLIRNLQPFTVRFLSSNGHAIIEKVGGYRKGSGGNLGSAMFKFGQQYERVCMALVANSIDFQEVPPQRWQGYLKIMPKQNYETKSQFKNRLRSHAEEIYKRSVTLWEADALLMLEYLRRSKGV